MDNFNVLKETKMTLIEYPYKLWLFKEFILIFSFFSVCWKRLTSGMYLKLFYSKKKFVFICRPLTLNPVVITCVKYNTDPLHKKGQKGKRKTRTYPNDVKVEQQVEPKLHKNQLIISTWLPQVDTCFFSCLSGKSNK